MRLLPLLALMLLLLPAVPYAQPGDYYHSLDEAYAEIDALVNGPLGALIKVDTVGYSQKDQEPILLVKISDNPEVDEDEPAVLIIGHIHGEEILGLEIILEAMNELLANPNPPIMRDRWQQTEIYFVPTMNPEGLRVVWGEDMGTGDLNHGADVTYRKNKRINLNDGLFKYELGQGNDTSGVDLNRNWGLNWIHGDTLLHFLDEAERYDYYRGHEPFSEPEVQVVADLHRQIHPLYGITYHSSRSGSFSEKVFFPWDWNSNDGLKLNPDFDTVEDLGVNFASQISRLGATGTYEAAPTAGRNAKMHDWTYAEGHWLNLEVEVGNNVIQPSEADRDEVVADNLPGIYYLIDRARGVDLDDGQSGHLAVKVTDENGQPMLAEVFTPDYWNGYLTRRFTEPVHGVHRRALLAQNYNVITRAWGYEPDTSVMNVGPSGEARYNVQLQPKPSSFVHLRAIDATTQEAVPATFVIHKLWESDTLYEASGDYRGTWPNEPYTVEFWSPGYIPREVSFDLDGTHLAEVQMVEPDDMLMDDFESVVPDHWVTEAGSDFEWSLNGFATYDGSARALKSNPEQWLESNTSGAVIATYDVPDGAESLVLTGYVRYDLEPDYDFGYVETSIDGGPWEEVDVLNGFVPWRPFFIDFRDAIDADQIRVRWTVTTDESENDRGVFLDDVALKWSSTWVSAPEDAAQPMQWAFHAAYPNPFNPSTRLEFDLAQPVHATLVVYDVLGREVARLVDQQMQAGSHVRSLDLRDAASGVYFARLEAGPFQQMQKIVLMK